MMIPFPSPALRDRVLFLGEHVMFALFGYYCLVIEPDISTGNGPTKSWLLNPALCWIAPVYEFNWFELFYVAKTGTHIEDVLYIL